jgi:hypothetical protein
MKTIWVPDTSVSSVTRPGAGQPESQIDVSYLHTINTSSEANTVSYQIGLTGSSPRVYPIVAY